MQLIDHVSITVRDIEAARPFYRAIMTALGATVAYEQPDAIGFGERNGPTVAHHSYLSVFRSDRAAPDPRRHWCFKASSTEAVRAFHAAGLAAGGSDAGPPGSRSYHAGYYAAFLLDPEGNKVEAVFHGGADGPPGRPASGEAHGPRALSSRPASRDQRARRRGTIRLASVAANSPPPGTR